MTEREIFLEALEISTAEARAAYLHIACGADVTLRHQVDELLKEHFSHDSLMAGPAFEREPIALEDADQEAAGQTIGRYKLLEKIGEGGFGEVWMVEQREPVKRRVALKILKLGMDSRQIVARFEAERQALAMMDHANIARIFDAGVTEAGRPYFVMELVRGLKITEYCDQNQSPTAERLKLFIEVCHAIQHAHQKGIIHRDIKPSNILVTLHDGVPVPKVIDFGIAKATQQELTDRTVFTQFQQFIGTPAYISPEQAEMSGLDIDTRTDIYSLGVLLYELLVGQTPFDAKEMLKGGIDGLRQVIREKEPLPPSTRLNTLPGEARTTACTRRQTDVGKLVHQLQGDLDWIVMKCLEKDRRRRYETANGLAADIKRYLTDEPVLARPPGKAYQFQKFFRRNKVMSVATMLVLTAILSGTAISIAQALRAQRELRRALAAESEAQREKTNAQEAERDARHQLYTALFEQARATVLSGEMGHRVKALHALRRAATISNNVELRREVFAALMLPDLRFERDIPIGQNVTQAQCDPAFKRIALCRGSEPVEIRSLDSGSLLASLPASTNFNSYALRWSDNGRYLMVKRDHPPNGFRSDWEVWEVTAPQRVMLIRDLRGESIAFHPQSNLVMAARSNVITLSDPETGREIDRFSITHEPRRLEISSDGKRVALLHDEQHWQIVSVLDSDRRAVTTSWKFSEAAGDVRWHPRGKWLALTDYSGKVQLLDVESGSATVLGRHKAEATTLTFSPDGEYLFSGGWDRELICWDLRTLQRAFTAGTGSYHLQFSADGRKCATLVRSPVVPGYFLELQLHAFEPPAAHRQFSEDLGIRLEQAVFSPDGRWLAAAGKKRLGLWSLTSKGSGHVIEAPLMARLEFTPDGAGLFGSGFLGECLQWRIPFRGEPAVPQLIPLPLPKSAGFNSVCVISNHIIWTGPKGSRIQSLDGAADDAPWFQTSSGVSGVSHDGQWLGIYGYNSTQLQIYQLPAFTPLADLTNRAIIQGFKFSPRGDELAISTRSGLQFWSTRTWAPTRELAGFKSILYGSDGRSIWLTKDYRTAGLFDARTLELLLPLPGGMLPLALSSDGRFLAVNANSRSLQVWDLAEVRRQLGSLGLDWVD